MILDWLEIVILVSKIFQFLLNTTNTIFVLVVFL